MTTITVVPTVEASNVPPRIRLDVTDVGSSPAYTATTVLRLDPDGVERPVRTADGNPLVLTTSGADRVGLLYDYEAPFGQAVNYSTQESPTVITADVTVDAASAWLIHPGVPSLSQAIMVASIGARSRRVQRGVFYVLGRAKPVVQTDGQRKAPEYTLSIFVDGEADRAAIETLFDDAGVLLLNVPASKGWGIGAEYVSIGDTDERRVSPFAGAPERMFDLPLVVVDPPAGGSQAERSYVDVLADYATYAAVKSAYSTYLALTAGP